jgi:heterodisulfide reductase subunit B
LNKHYLFRGCLIPTRLPFLEKASIIALERMGFEFDLFPEATCCMEPIGLRSMALDTWKVTAARMLAVAEADGRDVVTLCNGCFMSLKEAAHLLSNENERDEVNRVLADIGMKYNGTTNVKHLLEVVAEKGEDSLKSMVTTPLEGMRVGIHPGCHLVRPSSILGVENPFSPELLLRVTEWLGAEVVHAQNWPGCCGGGLTGVNEEVSSGILREIVEEFKMMGAEYIVTPCPFCFIQFDLKQKEGLPVIYLGELLALAFGASTQDIGMKHHRIKLAP